MFQALSSLRSRLFGAPDVPQSAPAQTQEWVSLDLDPELTTFGSKAPAVAAAETVALDVAPSAGACTHSPDAALVIEAAPAAAAQHVEPSFDGIYRLDGGDVLDGADDDSVVELDFSGVVLPAPATPESVPLAASTQPGTAQAAPATVRKPKRATARKGGGKAKVVAAGAPQSPDGVKKPARRSGLGLNGTWKLPGVDGFVPLGVDDSVENVRLELMLPSAEG